MGILCLAKIQENIFFFSRKVSYLDFNLCTKYLYVNRKMLSKNSLNMMTFSNLFK